MQLRLPLAGDNTDGHFGPDAPAQDNSGITPVGSAAFAAWVDNQFQRVVIRQCYGRWEAECPVCGDILYRTIGGRSALLRGIRRHLDGYPPFGLEFLAYKVGDKFVHNGEDYEVYSGPHRPASRYKREHPHVFFLVLRKLSTGSLWQTSPKKAGELRMWRER